MKKISPVITTIDGDITMFVDKYGQYTELGFVNDFQQIQGYVKDVDTYFAEVDAQVDTVDESSGQMLGKVSKQVDDLNKPITDYDPLRSQAIQIVFAFVLVIIVLQGLISVMDTYCPDGRRPNQQRCIPCITVMLTTLFLVTTLLMFLLGFALYILTATTVCLAALLPCDHGLPYFAALRGLRGLLFAVCCLLFAVCCLLHSVL